MVSTPPCTAAPCPVTDAQQLHTEPDPRQTGKADVMELYGRYWDLCQTIFSVRCLFYVVAVVYENVTQPAA